MPRKPLLKIPQICTKQDAKAKFHNREFRINSRFVFLLRKNNVIKVGKILDKQIKEAHKGFVTPKNSAAIVVLSAVMQLTFS